MQIFVYRVYRPLFLQARVYRVYTPRPEKSPRPIRVVNSQKTQTRLLEVGGLRIFAVNDPIMEFDFTGPRWRTIVRFVYRDQGTNLRVCDVCVADKL